MGWRADGTAGILRVLVDRSLLRQKHLRLQVRVCCWGGWQGTQPLWLRSNIFQIQDFSAAAFGYTLNRFHFDLRIALALGMIYRAVSVLLLHLTKRDKQR